MPLFDFISDEEARGKAQSAHDDAIKKVTDGVDAKINEEVDRLKAKNEEILGEKKKIQKLLENFKDLDPEKAREALIFLENNENARLLKEGKIDELLAKQTSQIKTDYEDKLSDLKTELETERETGIGYKSLYETKTIEDEIRTAGIKAGIRPEALPDIISRGLDVFTLGEDKTVEARDGNGQLKKTEGDLILNPENWVTGLKSEAPHYWPESEGAGFLGPGKGGATDATDQLAAAAKKGDMKLYRAIREKQKKAAVGN